jgi:hypothetical protein
MNESATMKTISLLTILTVLATFDACADVSWYLNSGPVAFKLTASAQNLDRALVSATTNRSATATNITLVSKSTITNCILDSRFMLELLQNSLNTTFPTGAKLAVTRVGDDFIMPYVADSTGTNILLGNLTNLFFGVMQGAPTLRSGSEVQVTKITATGTASSGNATETTSDFIVLGYDDTGLITRDGTHTWFQCSGVLTRKSSRNLASDKISDAIKLEGTGYGLLRDQPVLLKGTVTAVITGTLPPGP